MSGGLLATNAMAVFARFQDRYLLRMVRHGLRGVSIRGAMPAGPFVWAANHHSWWDPFVAAATIKKADFDALNESAARDFPGFWAKLARDEVLWKKPLRNLFFIPVVSLVGAVGIFCIELFRACG